MKKVLAFFQQKWTSIMFWMSTRSKMESWVEWAVDSRQILMEMVKSANSLQELRDWVKEAETDSPSEPKIMPGSDLGVGHLRMSHWGARLYATHFRGLLESMG